MIEEYYARSESDAVTFSFRTIAFSASLVKKHGLDVFDYARVGIDSELRRIYFSFQKDPCLVYQDYILKQVGQKEE